MMCDADTTVMTYYWFKGEDVPIPTMRNPRKCRKYEDVWQWAVDHQAPAPIAGYVTKPADAVELEGLGSTVS